MEEGSSLNQGGHQPSESKGRAHRNPTLERGSSRCPSLGSSASWTLGWRVPSVDGHAPGRLQAHTPVCTPVP